MEQGHKVAYISRLSLPDRSANALQTVHMAAAFARQTGDAHLFVANLKESEKRARERYSIQDSPVRFWPLRSRRWSPLVYPAIHRRPWNRARIENSLTAAILRLHPEWRSSHERGQRRVLFMVGRMEAMYWGLTRQRREWLRDWVLVYEVHDMLIASRANGVGPELERTSLALKALGGFDMMTTVTRGIADDMEAFTFGRMRPFVVPQAMNMERPPTYRPPLFDASGSITVGYIGTQDQTRGVDDVIRAARYLPDNFRLRLVGRALPSTPDDSLPGWLSELLREPEIARKVERLPAVPYAEVARYIDECDIVVQPAGLNDMFSRYASPLKLFDYMARGKPIVAARVPCHQEVLTDGLDCLMYRADDPPDLAERIMALARNPRLAEAIGRAAWEKSADHTYEARARRILELVDEAAERRIALHHSETSAR